MHLLYALIVNLIGLLLFPLRALLRARAAPAAAWLEAEVDGQPREVDRRRPWYGLRRRPLALQSLRHAIALGGGDSRVVGLLLRLRNLRGGGATAAALRDALQRARQRGLKVAVYLPAGGGTRSVFVAAAADLVLVGPHTTLAPLGFAIEAHYLRAVLDRAGIEPEVLARGRYKSAGEFLVAETMSEPQREQLEALLDAAYSELIDGLTSGRRVPRSLAEQWVDEGPWSARAAVTQRIADAIAYPEEVPRRLDSTRPDGAALVPVHRYLRRRQIRWRSLRRPPYIAVIRVHGPIVPGRAPGPVPMALEEPVSDVLRQVAEDPRARGAVVHINSPGGSAQSSHLLHHELGRLAASKPVVACLGDVAASGGYLLACAAHTIVAQRTTVTGSIGVVAARVVVASLLQRVGVGVEVVRRGARAMMNLPAHRLDDGEREALQQQLDDTYQSFLEVVAVGRGRTVEQIDSLARGRIYSGDEAVARGLVDQIGGFDTALEELSRRIGRGGERLEPILVRPRQRQWHAARLPSVLGGMATRLGLGPLASAGALAAMNPSERVWLWCPLAVFDSADL